MATGLKRLDFQHRVIDADPPGARHDVCLIGDINGDGRPDVVIGSKYGLDNLVWYENPGWQRHTIGTTHAEAGGLLLDITGNGFPDLVVGCPMDAPSGYSNRHLSWFRHPGRDGGRWRSFLITDRFCKYHDQAAGDVDGDGEPEIVFAAQGSRALVYADIPPDPCVSPWPEECFHVIATDLHVEGVKVADIDGDGHNEIIAGPNIFKRTAEDRWERRVCLEGIDPRTCVAIADLTGDGRLDIVLSEGECDRGKIIWLRNPSWNATILGEDFFHPHSLDVADFDGTGNLDVFVGEMGLNGYPKPRCVVFRNLGGGRFRQETVAHLPTHCARTADMNGDGRPDIVGKPYDCGRDQVDLLINRT